MNEIQGQAISQRNPYWDNIKGILIILVVFGHFLWDYWGLGFTSLIVSFIYFFHMPAMIFVSGFMSKSANSRSRVSIFKLVIIYIVFNTIIMVVSYFLLDTKLQLITPSYSSWFLISLIIWRLTIKYFEKFKNVLKYSIIVAILIGLWSDVTNVFAISRTIVFFPFFIAGYKLPIDKMNNFINNRKSKDYLKGILLLFLTIFISSLFLYKFTALSKSNLLMENYVSLVDLLVRIVILGIAGLMTMSIVILTSQKPLPFLCKWGRNSLIIYILHRFGTLVFVKVFPSNSYNSYYIVFASCASVITLIFLGSNLISRRINGMINKISDAVFSYNINSSKRRRNLYNKIPAIVLIICLSLPILLVVILPTKAMPASSNNLAQNNSVDVIHKVMTSQQETALKNAISIAFVGDLILLRDQVKQAYSDSTGKYEFNSMFKYAKRYLSEADLSIGVFEGPMAGEEVGYSTSNFNDGIPLYLNYPDSFARAVKDSGIDLVSTANNHLLDKGEAGAMRTLDVLDEAGLLHIGSYRNETEKNNITIIERKGVRIAVLAYTYGCNGYTEDYFLHKNTSLTSVLAEPDGRYFEETKAKVLSDFQQIKDMKNPPDLIAVIPHMGSQFTHETDTYQNTWNDIFINAGADIVLGDHSHAVQPIEFRTKKDNKGKEKRAIIVNSPGNFANSYIEKDGDATSIADVYINPETKDVICAGVIPMYTQSTSNGDYRALPIYDILNDPVLQNEISRYEMGRVAEVQDIVSSVMLGTRLTLDQAQDKYYLFPEGYVRQPVKAIKVTDKMRETNLYKLLSKSKTICFVGDSITAGSKNGGYGWFEPLNAIFADSIVYKEAWASATTRTLLDNSKSISEHSADLYVIAIGTNDVRYRDEKTCAMDAGSYVRNINSLIEKILSKNPNSKFVLISPWLALDNDPYTAIPIEKRDLMLEEYGKQLELYCEEKGYYFVNPNPDIAKVFLKNAPSHYLIDHIHPNANAGIALYSEKVLEYIKR